MKLTSDIVQTAELSARDREAWLAFKRADGAFYSPYFHPDYARTVAQVRGKGQVLRILKNGQAVGFLPFDGGKVGRPVGAPMTDYHGPVCEPGLDMDFKQVLRQVGMSIWRFDNLIDPVGRFSDYVVDSGESVVMDVSMGPDKWRVGRDSSYRRKLKKDLKRLERAGEEVGEVRYVSRTCDADTGRQLIDWKKAQFAYTGLYDIFTPAWTRQLLKALVNRKGEELRAECHSVWFGDQLAAVDLGLTADRVYHSWIVAYNPELSTYSPGYQILEYLITESPRLEYDIIDLGGAQHDYKRYYADREVKTYSGYVSAGGLPAMGRQLYGAGEALAAKLPLGKLSDAPARLRRRYAQVSACEPSLAGRMGAMMQALKSAKGSS